MPSVSLYDCNAIRPPESEKFDLTTDADPEEPREVAATATVIGGSVEAVIEVNVEAVATADAVPAVGGVGCEEVAIASVAVPVLLVATAFSGFPLASLAAIVTIAGLPAVPPMTKAP